MTAVESVAESGDPSDCTALARPCRRVGLDPPPPWPRCVMRLAAGLDPAIDPPRTAVPVRSGELMAMPSDGPDYTGVKLLSIAPGNAGLGVPRIQGIYLLFDAKTLTPVALLDGVAMTNVRTAAVSALAATLLADPDAHRLVVFGTGPQAHAHITALAAVLPITGVTMVARSAESGARFAARMGRSVAEGRGGHGRTGGRRRCRGVCDDRHGPAVPGRPAARRRAGDRGRLASAWCGGARPGRCSGGPRWWSRNRRRRCGRPARSSLRLPPDCSSLRRWPI